jgi:CubicO group peptidase (beta-lactamase class C family)
VSDDDVLERVHGLPIDTVAVGVTDRDQTLATEGPVDTVLPFASVTKPLAAYATLIAVQDGALHLDEPAGPPDGPDGITVRHLLAHASGLPLDDDGAPIGQPEKRRVYSNWGFEVLGELVAARVGTSFADHLAHDLLDPLGMGSTRVDGSPARDGQGTVGDLLAFARELLAPTLLDDDLHREATTVAFPGLDGVLPGYGRQTPNDWGLGFELKDGKDPHWTGERNSSATFGHFGQSGSFLWVDPERGLGAAFLADRAFGSWASDAWPGLNDAIVDAYGASG